MRSVTQRAALSQTGASSKRVVYQTVRRCATPAAATPSTSLAAGFFKVKIVSKEMFPFPTRAFTSDEGENLETVVRNVQELKEKTTTREVVEWGVPGAPIASEYGGLELSETAHTVALEELARHAPAAAYCSLLNHVGACAYMLKSYGNSSIKARYLGGMSDASMRFRFAVSEAHAGTDVSMNTTTATAHEDGSYTLDGTKLVHAASDATHFLVMARAPTQTTGADGSSVMVHKGTFFVVEKASKGVEITQTTDTNMQLVSFSGALAHDVVGVMGEGQMQYMVTLHSTHHVVGATLLGLTKKIVTIALESAKQSGSPILQALVSSATVEMYGLESTLYALTANLDAKVDDSLIESTICASLISRTTQSIAQRLSSAVQYATPKENEAMTVAVNDLQVLLSLATPSEFLLSCAACCGIEDFGLYFQKASTLETMQSRAIRGLGIRDNLPLANAWPECRRIEENVVKFGAAVEHVFVRQNMRLKHSTLTLVRIGEAAALLYAATATASRVVMAEKKGVAGSAKKIASQYISSAMDKVDELCDETRNSGKTADEAFKRIAMEVCENTFRAAGGVVEVPPPSPEAAVGKNSTQTAAAATEGEKK